jgi:hypothetical protein
VPSPGEQAELLLSNQSITLKLRTNRNNLRQDAGKPFDPEIPVGPESKAVSKFLCQTFLATPLWVAYHA